jgi:type II secretory pathway pseudopilin PulG
MHLPTDRRGFALPVVILIIALLTVLLTSGLTRARTERQIADASDETSEALVVAQSGLQTYFGTVTTRPSDGDSSRINVIGGYANVVVYLVRQPADTLEESLYLVRSTGYVINPDSGAVPRARRTVAQFATWGIARIERLGALTAINGLRHHDTPNIEPRLEVSGIDQCGVAPAIAGIRTSQMVWAGTDPDTSLTGSPAGVVVQAGATILANQRIDWPGVLGSNLTPDYTAFQNGSVTYPIQRVLGSLSVSGVVSGTGLLVVRDDFTTSGTQFFFNGIILVGRRALFRADSNVVRGLVVTGLDPAVTSPSETGGNPSGNERHAFLYYNSCIVQQVLARIAGLSPVRNAWLDTWASY